MVLNKKRHKLLIILAIPIILLGLIITFANLTSYNLQALFLNAEVKQTEVWFATSNSGLPSGNLSDFEDLFNHPEQWRVSRKSTAVIQFHSSDIDDMTPEFLHDKVMPVLKTYGTRIALNVTGANWSQCSNRDGLIYEDEELINKVIAAGGEVKYLSLQSTLSKWQNNTSRTRQSLISCFPYSSDKRIADVVRYVSYMKEKFPNIKIGLYDADPTMGNPYKAELSQLKSSLAQQNLALDYYLLDNGTMYLDQAGTASDLVELQRYFQNTLDMKFGVTFTALPTNTTNEGFDSQVITSATKYKNAGGNPDFYALGSWRAFPDKYLPENSSTDFPMTKTLLKLQRLVLGNSAAEHNTLGIKGRLDFIRLNGLIGGWASKESDDALKLKIFIYIDGNKDKGTLIGNTTANLNSTLVGEHKFKFKIPFEYKDGNDHTLYVYASPTSEVNDAIELGNSPKRFNLSSN